MNKLPPAPKRHRWPLPAALLLALAVVAWLQRPDGRLHVALLETGGDAALIRTPAGRFVLVDGGRDPTQLAMRLGRELPFWRRDLLAVVLTAPGGRRLPGQVAALARYRPGTALAPPRLGAGGTAGEWRRLVAAHEARTQVLRAGQRLDLDGATLTVLAAESGDEGGAVLLLTYGATRVLFHTGGSAGDAAALRAAGRPVDLLLYPWQRRLDTPLIAALRPRAIAFTAAYEAPDPALLSYADRRRHSPRLYHTENDGTVELVSDGRRVTITTDKP
jgi:beta-lactamase superfamily II metal-dependent hydrolase